MNNLIIKKKINNKFKKKILKNQLNGNLASQPPNKPTSKPIWQEIKSPGHGSNCLAYVNVFWCLFIVHPASSFRRWIILVPQWVGQALRDCLCSKNNLIIWC